MDSPNNRFIYHGRSDGIGNRIEELIYIQEYCIENRLWCIYVWNNSGFRSYLPLITFSRIIIVRKIEPSMKDLEIMKNNVFQRTKGFLVKYDFLFKPPSMVLEYDTIVHIRGTDRLTDGIGDFSSYNQLNMFIRNTIHYLNSNSEIQTYTIVSDDEPYKETMKSEIKKKYVELCYDQHESSAKDWLDYYYLTKPKQSIIMCCKFSSFSITASILANKKLLVFSPSLGTNLPRYKANIEIIE